MQGRGRAAAHTHANWPAEWAPPLKPRRAPSPLTCAALLLLATILSVAALRAQAHTQENTDTPQVLKIYFHKIPRKFTDDIIEYHPQWKDEPATHSCEVIIFDRLRKLLARANERVTITSELSAMRVMDPERADLFYLPIFPKFYHDFGQQVNRDISFETMLKKSVSGIQKSALGRYWRMCDGCDHVVAFGSGAGPGIIHSTTIWAAFMNSVLLVIDGDKRFLPRKDVIVPYPSNPPLFLPDQRGLLWNGTRVAAVRRDIFVYLRCGAERKGYRKELIALFASLQPKDTVKVRPVRNGTIVTDRKLNPTESREQMAADMHARAEFFRDSTPGSVVHERLRRGAVLVTRVENLHWRAFLDEFKRSVFCLVPEGVTSSSKRLYEAILAGCIPVVLSDRFLLPFPHAIPYAGFVVSIPQARTHDVVPLLYAMPPDEIERRRAEMEKWWLAMTYQDPPVPGDATFHIVEALAARARQAAALKRRVRPGEMGHVVYPLR